MHAWAGREDPDEKYIFEEQTTSREGDEDEGLKNGTLGRGSRVIYMGKTGLKRGLQLQYSITHMTIEKLVFWVTWLLSKIDSRVDLISDLSLK